MTTLQEVGEALARLEARLDPAHPESAGVKVLAYGEISAALIVADEPALTGSVVKRMAGFADEAAARHYVALVRDYVERLQGIGLRVLATQAITIRRPAGGPVVYLVQPLVAADLLGNRLLLESDDQGLASAVRSVLDCTAQVLRANDSDTHVEIAIDEQMSNWVFDGDEPMLIDVGTPFMRLAGSHLFDEEILLSAVPPGIRAYYRAKGTAAAYMDDYFDARLCALDLLGNFHKEGAAWRVPLGLAVVNEWLMGAARGLPGSGRPVTEAEVRGYYEEDAATLELFLRVRRVDRALRRALGRSYDFVLPGPVAR